MPYGTIKVDNVIYTKGGVDTTITVSGIVDSLSGAISVTGSISGASVSAPTGTFTTLSGNTTAGTTATFTSGVFTTFSGTTVNVVSGVFASGTVAAPSVSVGTSGNGLYSPGANQLAISTSGTGRLTVDNSGNVNIDSGTFYVDAVNNRVGVNNNGPSYNFDVTGNFRTTSNGIVGTANANANIEIKSSVSSGGSGYSELLLGNASGSTRGYLSYNHSNDTLLIGTQASTKATLDASGNLGLGVTPSAWKSSYKGFDIGTGGLSAAASIGLTQLTSNAYYNASNQWIYKVADSATYYQQYAGYHQWYTSTNTPSAGGAITFTQAMMLTPDGNLGIGGTPVFYYPGSNNIELGNVLRFRGNAEIAYANSALNINNFASTPIVFYTSNTECARIDSSGNLGLGVVPSAWSNYKALQIGAYLNLSYNAGFSLMGSNAYHNGTNWIYQNTAAATDYYQYNGTHVWRTAPSGTAGAAITFTQAMTLDASGNLGVGETSMGSIRLAVKKNDATTYSSSNFNAQTHVFLNNTTNGGYSNLILGCASATTGSAAYAGLAVVSEAASDTNGALAFGTRGAGAGNIVERARIDSSGRLLVGTSSARGNMFNGNISPVTQVEGTVANSSISAIISSRNDSGGGFLALAHQRSGSLNGNTILSNNDYMGGVSFQGNDGTNFVVGAEIAALVDGTPGANDMPGRLVFSTTADGAASPTERMTIDNAGTTTFSPASATSAQIINVTNNVTAVSFRISGTQYGYIQVATTGTTYSTSSDYRIKENVTAVTDGITRLQQLKPSRFNFITDPDKTVDGFIAHEVQPVVPEAITGEKDAIDNDGNPIYQGIDQSKLVPLLTAALQEAIAKIESLESRLTAAGI